MSTPKRKENNKISLIMVNSLMKKGELSSDEGHLERSFQLSKFCARFKFIGQLMTQLIKGEPSLENFFLSHF